MSRRRTLVLLFLAAGPLLALRARKAATRERVVLHYDDGSTVTLERGSLEADALVATARSLVPAR